MTESTLLNSLHNSGLEHYRISTSCNFLKYFEANNSYYIKIHQIKQSWISGNNIAMNTLCANGEISGDDYKSAI